MRGDFTGFSFDGIHSSDLNIVRVSDGDRYKESLLPDFDDNTLAIPGRDGEFYFGSNYKNKPIELSIAFDSITEKNLRQVQQLFSTRKACKLIFDERPYKVYTARISQPIELEYICFDEPNFTWEKVIIGYDKETGEPIYQKGVTGADYEHKVYDGTTRRAYKGEGNVEFICSNPFAQSLYKTLEEYSDYSNVEEWEDASGILHQTEYDEQGFDRVQESDDSSYNAMIPVYNAGNIDAPFYLYLPYTNYGQYNPGTLDPAIGENIVVYSGDENALIIESFTSRKNFVSESGILINTNNHLIEGVIDRKGALITTGEIYNNYIKGGDFGKILHEDFVPSDTQRQVIYVDCATAADMRIEYNYWYY